MQQKQYISKAGFDACNGFYYKIKPTNVAEMSTKAHVCFSGLGLHSKSQGQ